MGVLRFLLAIAVVINHSSPIFGITSVGGKLAVQAFYVISGFYMSLILNEKYVGANGRYSLYITNRLLRLFPVYWAVLIAAFAWSLVVGVHTGGRTWDALDSWVTYGRMLDPVAALFLVVANIGIWFQDVIMFMGLDTATGTLFLTPDFRAVEPVVQRFLLIPQAWTIAVELTFYLVAPFIVRRRPYVAALLIAASLTLRWVLKRNGFDHDPWDYRFFPNEIVFFLWGTLGYRAYTILRRRPIPPLVLGAAWVGIVAFTLAYEFIGYAGRDVLYLASVVAAVPLCFMLTRNWRIDAYIGELSYPIYVSHLLVLSGVLAANLAPPATPGSAVALGSVVAAVLLNELVAKPVEARRQKRLRPTLAVPEINAL